MAKKVGINGFDRIFVHLTALFDEFTRKTEEEEFKDRLKEMEPVRDAVLEFQNLLVWLV